MSPICKVALVELVIPWGESSSKVGEIRVYQSSRVTAELPAMRRYWRKSSANKSPTCLSVLRPGHLTHVISPLWLGERHLPQAKDSQSSWFCPARRGQGQSRGSGGRGSRRASWGKD